jgi:HK97 family phage prohead protease
METKLLSLAGVELKLDDGKPGRFAGYASVFNGVDAYGDTVLPGAFKATLKDRERPVRMRWNHYGPVIGKWVEVTEDDKGLLVVGELTPGHRTAEDTLASLRHGAVDGLSIGYRVGKDGALVDGERRVLKTIDLVEVSVVEEPADLNARVDAVKTLIDGARGLKDIEAILRDAGGFNRVDACALVARVKALAHGERVAERATSGAAVSAAVVKAIETALQRRS